MKKAIPVLFISLFLSLSINAQVIIEEKTGLVSASAFSKKISRDFSYLLLGENSPQQGISAVLNDKKSNIKINGLLYSGNKGTLSLEADLAASNGIYFFDEENGSQSGKISFNYYKNIWSSLSYNAKTPIEKAKTQLAIIDILAKAKAKYVGLKGLMTTHLLVLDTTDLVRHKEVQNELLDITRKYVNSQDDDGYDVLPQVPFDASPYIKLVTASDSITQNVTTSIATSKGPVAIPILSSRSKLLQDYVQQQKFILDSLENKIIDLEIKDAETKWDGQRIVFIGITPFYKRESFNRFTFNATQTFSDMFSNEKGDIYGLSGSLNFNYERGTNSGSLIKPNKLFVRGTVIANRASNIAGFRNSTLNLTTSVGNDVNGNPIDFTNTDAAFIGDATYEYGTGNTFAFDLYYYPFPIPVGIFGSIAYEYINFSSNKNIDDQEISPMRLGMLFNLKDKKKDSPLVTIQVFIDRTDLSLSPNGVDDDLRFGLGIGLPININ